MERRFEPYAQKNLTQVLVLLLLKLFLLILEEIFQYHHLLTTIATNYTTPCISPYFSGYNIVLVKAKEVLPCENCLGRHLPASLSLH